MSFPKKYASMAERLAANVSVCPVLGCYEWAGNRSRSGYGRLNVRAAGRHRKLFAHRLSFEASRGMPVPRGMDVHHLCYNSACINPQHLVLMSPADNRADRNSAAAREARFRLEARDAGRPF